MPTRRDFLRLAATAASAAIFPASIRKALAIPAHRATGTIQDVEHVVILMQENRSFDHYFGSLRGVRGFNDPRPAMLPSGKPVWHQPTAKVKTKHYQNRGLAEDATHVLPFYLNPKRTTEFQAGTDHGWSSGHQAWNNGHHDQWVTQKQDVLTMGYLKREDVSFHYALADAFTICDAYHCSVHSNTAPNRIYLWSGTMDASNRLGKKGNGPGFNERHHTNGYTWMTYPERLEASGVSWKLYQGGTGEPGTPTDNYTDNSLEFFAQYHVKEGAPAHSSLVIKGVTDHTLAEFHNDVVTGQLPQVSWIVAPYKYCEHPDASPRDGAYYINLILEALTANPDVWSKTVFIINYDENDGLFDHVIPPMPAYRQQQNAQGLVSPDLVDALRDEFINMDKYPHERRPLVPGSDPGGMQPVGLGPRVPLLIVSPWTTGGWVCSQTFDHTSVLQFLEARFKIPEPNVNAWRRAICGDLTSAFDFTGAATSMSTQVSSKFSVPDVLASLHEPYSVPAVQSMPQQEPGTRPARALPYAFYTHCRVDSEQSKFWIDFRNDGKAGAAFYARNNLIPHQPPRRYSVSAGSAVSDYWLLSDTGSDRKADKEPRTDPDYDVVIYGPNGFYGHLRGLIALPGLPDPEVSTRYDHSSGDIYLTCSNHGDVACTLRVVNPYAASEAPHLISLAAHATAEDHWSLGSSSNWFDLIITTSESPIFRRQFAGHVETGRPSMSDPATFTEEA
ncbi:phosphocholine-specific phospholipase C [Acidobacterium sp. S8]|uniref:phosphocholine-specific phospholipase C n=1 Tax=Acidobacterium sp. S8 TaxID=1641854 RepID=UPI00131B23D6|nr:phospholipase C, phosphocholine-specific [Acidobacterium sp. S8]